MDKVFLLLFLQKKKTLIFVQLRPWPLPWPGAMPPA
jgi:hypothetical protein